MSEKKTSALEANFKQSEEKIEKQKKRFYTVVSNQNRTVELNIAGETIGFLPHGINPAYPEKYSDGVPQEIIQHKDFESLKNYFMVKEN